MVPGLFACVIVGLAAALPARADERGPVTNLPLPRFVSMKAAEANVRRGPSLTHRIDWVFKHEDIPLEITAEHGHWRRVRDRDGAGGWVHYSLLSGVRTAIAEKDMLELHAQPDESALVIARLEIGVIARIETCTAGWCQLEVAGYEGWTPKETIWGVAADEILE